MSSSLTIHHEREPNPDISSPDPHQDVFSKTVMGFWTYLMTDCLLFATLFVTYVVLRDNTFGGPSGKELFDLPYAFGETMALLFSSVTCGLAVLSAVQNKTRHIIPWLSVTLLLGLTFLVMELNEFAGFIEQGYDWTVSAFLSAFFTLVGTHGTHITFGLIWTSVLIGQFAFQGLNADTFRRLVVYSLFWHFLDLIWIFIFTIVYLMGVL